MTAEQYSDLVNSVNVLRMLHNIHTSQEIIPQTQSDVHYQFMQNFRETFISKLKDLSRFMGEKSLTPKTNRGICLKSQIRL